MTARRGAPGASPDDRDAPRLLRATLGFFLVALAVHAVVALQYRGDPYFTTYVSDALSYHEWAGRIADHGLSAEPVFHQAPLFPTMLASVYALISDAARPLGAVILQLLLGCAAMALLVPLGRALLGSTAAGVAAAALALLHAPFVYYDLKLLPVPLALLTQAAGLLLLASARRSPGRIAALAAGAAWGVACLARAEMLLFVPIGALALWDGPRPDPLRRARGSLLYLAGALIVIAPVTAHNARRGDVVLIAASAGENLFIGNQRGGNGGHRPLHPQAGDLFSQRALARSIAEEQRGRELRPSEVSSYWRRRAVREVVEAPMEWVRLEGRKLGRVLHPGDPHDMYPLALERRHYLTSLYPLFVPAWWLWILAAVGIGSLLRSRRATTWPLMALLALQLGVLLVFFVSTRLRLPLLFFLCLPAGQMLREGWRRLRYGDRPLVPAIVAAALVVVALAGALTIRPTARDVRRLGSVLSIAGRLDESLAVLEPALLDPAAPGVLFDQAGWVHYQRGDLTEARERYLEALERGLPGHRTTQLRTRLGWTEEKLGQLAAAERQHDLAAGSADANAGTYYERGMFLLRRGRRDAAVEDLLRSARTDPGYGAPRDALRALGVDLR